MSLARILIASSAAFALMVPATIAVAQQNNRPAVTAKVGQKTKAEIEAARKASEAAKKANDTAAANKAAVEAANDRNGAAKAAVDELLAREPALAAAKEIRPSIPKAKVDAEKYKAGKAKVAAMKTKDDPIVARRKAIADQIKAREDAKVAALKAKHDAMSKAMKAKPVAGQTKAGANITVAKADVPAPDKIVRRMPTPDSLPPVVALQN
jgi:hypothetical protein